ncbi:MAG: metallophosphoesterase [Verrucomicrobia bacterium]|nr:metallophosphoesterase [Verrucomicrobiota bacterium]
MGRLPALSGVLFDARRALFLEESATLVVADLHLGYAWTQRRRGLLMPLGAVEDAGERMASLVRDHSPRTVVLLGDLVHRAEALPGIREELESLCRPLAGLRVLLCRGNHDRRIEALLSGWRLPIEVCGQWTAGRFLLSHGDAALPGVDGECFQLNGGDTVSVIGHEHPAVELGDGVATRVKAPCFLVAPDLVVLPAFSAWAAGCVAGRDAFLGPQARAARFETAVACLGPRLLPVPLDSRRKPAAAGLRADASQGY